MIPAGLLLVVFAGLVFLLVYGFRPMSAAAAERLTLTVGKVSAVLIVAAFLSTLSGVR